MNSKNKDFLLEDKFIEWQLFQTEELNHYWETFRIENPESTKELDKAIEEFEALTFNTKKLPQDEKQAILNTVFKRKRKRKFLTRFIQTSSAVAAVAVIGLFIMLFFNTDHSITPIADNTIVGQTLPEEDVYIISGNSKTKLANNSNLELTTDKKVVVTDSTEETKEVNLAVASINRLVVPYGKRSSIILSDGSKVWLNSGTQIDFPTEFIGNKREISINGEIYIDVKENEKIPFIVNTSNMSIQVYGTSFNVSAYQEDAVESIVLVEGKVGVTILSLMEEVVLKPNEKMDLTDEVFTKKTVDVSEYISWTRDVLEFDKTPISEILRKVGRYYNVQFENSPDIPLNEKTCSGKLFLSNNLDSVMTSISKLSSTKYERNNNIIHIRKK